MSFLLLSPEIILVAAAVAIYLGGAAWRSERPWPWAAAGGIAPAALALGCWGSPAPADPLAQYARWLALGLGAILLLTAWQGKRGQSPFVRHPRGTRLRAVPAGTERSLVGDCPLFPLPAEYIGSLLLSVAGLMLAAGAQNLVLLVVSLELISIPTYILLAVGRRDPAGQEAAAKYFFLSVLASVLFLYGLSFLYGVGGSMELSVIRDRLGQPQTLSPGFETLARLAMVLVAAGLCFRVTAVPFHFYAPDVYQGTSHANAALLSVLPKAAGLVVLVRLVLLAMPGMAAYAWKVALVLAVLSMTLGNMLALWQDNLRRLMAYSSIANAGYMLIGLCVALAGDCPLLRPGDCPNFRPSENGTVPFPADGGWWGGVAAMLFYLGVYAAATLGMFAALAHLGGPRRQVDTIDELAGLAETHPALAAAVATCMLSLAGLPPAAGLWAKLLVFGSALAAGPAAGDHYPWLVALVLVGVLNAAIGAYYYLRIVGVMYFRPPVAALQAAGGRAPWLAAMACALAVLAVGVYPGPWMQVSSYGPTPLPRPGVDPSARLGRGAAVRAGRPVADRLSERGLLRVARPGGRGAARPAVPLPERAGGARATGRGRGVVSAADLGARPGSDRRNRPGDGARPGVS
jgi:NADH-quinone oxidoreductase subunit N